MREDVQPGLENGILSLVDKRPRPLCERLCRLQASNRKPTLEPRLRPRISQSGDGPRRASMIGCCNPDSWSTPHPARLPFIVA